MQMNISCDYDGYVYFHELLFYFFRFSLLDKIYYSESRNKASQIETALQIIIKEEQISMKKMNYFKK